MERVLVSLQSADNNLRDGAEKELDAMLQQPEEALLQLVHLMGHARDTKVRARASLCLRHQRRSGLLTIGGWTRARVPHNRHARWLRSSFGGARSTGCSRSSRGG